MTDRREFQKERPRMKKRKQRDERKEAGRRQTRGYERNAKERASGNIQTQNLYTRAIHGPKMEEVSNPLCPFCNTYLSVDHIVWECKEIEDQRMNMDMRKEQWINGKKGMEKIIDYSKEIGLYNRI
jgi:hypothetical protein